MSSSATPTPAAIKICEHDEDENERAFIVALQSKFSSSAIDVFDQMSNLRMADGSQIPDEFKCVLCGNLLYNPKQCKECQDPFCSTCISKRTQDQGLTNCPNSECIAKQIELQEYNKFNMKKLYKVEVVCTRSTCPQKETPFKYNEVVFHFKDVCSSKVEACPLDCGAQISKADFENHQIEHLESCPNRKVKCPECSKEILVSHQKWLSQIEDLKQEIEFMQAFSDYPVKASEDNEEAKAETPSTPTQKPAVEASDINPLFLALTKQPPRPLADGHNITLIGKWAQLGGSQAFLQGLNKRGTKAEGGPMQTYKQIYIKNANGDDGVYTGEVNTKTDEPHGLGRWECSQQEALNQVYEGQWENGKRNGFGREIKCSSTEKIQPQALKFFMGKFFGTVKEGTWVDNHFQIQNTAE